VYFALVWSTRVDVPILDDFDAILGFDQLYAAADSCADRLALVVKPHVDHRLALTRITALGVEAIAGHVDFAALSLIGNLGLLVLFIGLATRTTGAVLLSASLLLFQPQASQLLHFPTASIATCWVLAIAFAVFRLLEGDSPGRWACAWVGALAAILTQGNGVVVYPAALAGLWLAGRGRAALRWGALAIPVLLVYAITYQGRSSVLPPGDRIARTTEMLHYFLNFLGAAPAFSHEWLAAPLGLALCAGFAVLTARGAVRDDPARWTLGLFVILTAAGNAWLRSGLGAGYALDQSRYRVYSTLFLVICLLGASDRIASARRRRVLQGLSLAGSLAFAIASYALFVPEVERDARVAARSVARWSVSGEGLEHPDPLRAGGILRRARREGTYRHDPAALARFLDREVEREVPTRATGRVAFSIDRIAMDDDFAMIEGRATAAGAAPASTRAFVVLDGAAGRQVLTTQRIGRGGFRLLLPRSALRPAAASIGLLLVDREFVAFVDTGRMLRANGAGG
jgi:hypothetical protein